MYNEGRSITGIESKDVLFQKLEKDVDFDITETNPLIENTNLKPEDFVYFCDPVSGDTMIKVEAPHWRAVSIPLSSQEIIQLDKERFFEVGVKGVGYL